MGKAVSPNKPHRVGYITDESNHYLILCASILLALGRWVYHSATTWEVATVQGFSWHTERYLQQGCWTTCSNYVVDYDSKGHPSGGHTEYYTCHEYATIDTHSACGVDQRWSDPLPFTTEEMYGDRRTVGPDETWTVTFSRDDAKHTQFTLNVRQDEFEQAVLHQRVSINHFNFIHWVTEAAD